MNDDKVVVIFIVMVALSWLISAGILAQVNVACLIFLFLLVPQCIVLVCLSLLIGLVSYTLDIRIGKLYFKGFFQ